MIMSLVLFYILQVAAGGGELASKVLRMTATNNMTERGVKAVAKLVNELVPESIPTSTKGLRNTIGK